MEDPRVPYKKAGSSVVGCSWLMVLAGIAVYVVSRIIAALTY